MTHSKPGFGQLLDDVLQAVVIRAQLDLSWKIEQHVCILSQLGELFFQPVEVGLEVFHGVEHPSVWS